MNTIILGSLLMRVSITTVCLNNAATIEQTINSVLSQKYPDIEYIIIDGGSTDGTVEIINKYTKKLFYFVSEPDNGIYNAMNKGLKASTGKIIAFLNADDIYATENVVPSMVSLIQNNSLDAAYGDLVYVNHNNANNVVRYWKTGEYKKGSFRLGWVIPHPTFFCKKAVFDKYGYFNENFRVAADFELMLRFIQKNKIKIGYLPEVLVKMRKGGRAAKLKGMVKGNTEILKSFRLNDIRISPWFFLYKPIIKISQLFKRPARY